MTRSVVVLTCGGVGVSRAALASLARAGGVVTVDDVGLYGFPDIGVALLVQTPIDICESHLWHQERAMFIDLRTNLVIFGRFCTVLVRRTIFWVPPARPPPRVTRDPRRFPRHSAKRWLATAVDNPASVGNLYKLQWRRRQRKNGKTGATFIRAPAVSRC